MDEYNVFELIGRLLAYLRGDVAGNQTSFCRQNRAGHHYVRLLWIRYTLTESELILRTLSTRRVELRALRTWSRCVPPEVRPGRSVCFTLECVERLTLGQLHRMAGGVHFVMLLGEATGCDLITPFLGCEGLSSVNWSGL